MALLTYILMWSCQGGSRKPRHPRAAGPGGRHHDGGNVLNGGTGRSLNAHLIDIAEEAEEGDDEEQEEGEVQEGEEGAAEAGRRQALGRSPKRHVAPVGGEPTAAVAAAATGQPAGQPAGELAGQLAG